jgi:hypothetical protein
LISGDNSEVVSASLENQEKIRVSLVVGIDDLSGSSNDLNIDKRIGNPASGSSEP